MRSLQRQLVKLVVLMAVCFGWSACSNDLALENDFQGGVITLTIDAQKGGQGQDTRGLTSSVQAIWSEGDQVTILNASGSSIGTMTPQTTGYASTKLNAKLTGTVKVDDPLTLVFPRSERDYTGQIGTLADIAAKYDYATAQVKVKYVNGTNASATDAVFTNQQAIVKFNLLDGTTPLNVTSLTISADGLKQNASTTGDITIAPTSATSEIYAALSGISNKTVSLTATDATDTYTYTSSAAKSFDDGKYYQVNVKMKKAFNPYATPLTLEGVADDGESMVWVTNYGDLEYRIDNGEWKTYKDEQFNLAKGHKISFRGKDATSTSSSDHMMIQCDDYCYIYGNIMSLLKKEDYATMTTLPYDETFAELFKGNEYLTHSEGKNLVLPASTLRKYCYFHMFYGCRSLNHIVCLATDISAEYCTYQWMYYVAESGTFVKAPSMTKWSEDDDGIPPGWTVIDN